MKLAKTIAEEIRDGAMEDHMYHDGSFVDVEEVESIITTHLRPLREALEGALELITKHHAHGYKADLVESSFCTVCTKDGSVDPVDELANLEAALAILEEE